MRTHYRLATIELMPLGFDFVLRSKDVLHVTHLSIDGKLVNIKFVLGVEKMQFSHVLDHLSEKIADTGFFVLSEEIFQHYFTLLVEPYLENNQFGCRKQSYEVVFNDGNEFDQTGKAESLENDTSAHLSDLGCVEIGLVVAEQDVPVHTVDDGSRNYVVHLRGKAENLGLHVLALSYYQINN